MTQIQSICWFQTTLRLEDNPALVEASKLDSTLALYILDTTKTKLMGEASKVFLHHSLVSLNKSLNGKLMIYSGDPKIILDQLSKKFLVSCIITNMVFEPDSIEKQKNYKSYFQQKNIIFKSFNASLLWDPNSIKKSDGTMYKVFTPFYRKGCLLSSPPRKPFSKPKKLNLVSDHTNKTTISDLNLLPKVPWDKNIVKNWDISESGAKNQLNTFIQEGLNSYKTGRNFPSKPFVSKLSPYLHFGLISIFEIWHRILALPQDKNTDHFLSELGWREFSYYLLNHFPKLDSQNWNQKFNGFIWKKNTDHLMAWKKGLTGYPIVDAGMRELYQTGWMHNRVRMIVGSFLVKNLLLDWRYGEAWFWDCLFDADLASNSASWQWVAGCGADAAPYFRIFNPVTQGEKFDADGEYTLKYVPELKKIPKKYLFCPWEAPKELLEAVDITLGITYPKPIVSHKQTREEALFHFSQLKNLNQQN